MSFENDVQSITTSLREVGDLIKEKSRETKEQVSELSARLQSAEQTLAELDTRRGGTFRVESIGSRVTDNLQASPQFEHLRAWNMGTARVEVAASIKAALVHEGTGSSSDTTLPRSPEQAGMVGPVLRPLRLLDVLPVRPTTRDSVEIIQLSADGDADEQDGEGPEKAEILVDGEKKTIHIATIAGHTTVSRQVLADAPALQAQIDRLLRGKLGSKLEHAIINGTGGEAKIDGLLNQATPFIPTVGTTPADIIGESLMRQADNGYLPGVIVMNPADWFAIQINKTDSGEYTFGSPAMPIPPALWNARVVVTPSITEGRFLTLDQSFVTVLDRESASVMLSNSHNDNFTRNLVTILAELRAGLEVADTGAVFVGDLSSSGS